MTDAIIVVEGRRYIRCCMCVGSGTVGIYKEEEAVSENEKGYGRRIGNGTVFYILAEVPCPNCGGTGMAEIPT